MFADTDWQNLLLSVSGPQKGPLGAIIGHLGAILGHLGASSGPTRCHFGPSRCQGALQKQKISNFDWFFEMMLRSLPGHSGAMLGHLGPILGHRRAVLGPFWAILGPLGHRHRFSNPLSNRCRDPRRAPLGPSWAILGLSWVPRWPEIAPRWPQDGQR